MASVRLGPNGEVEVLVPPTPEEVVEAKAALDRVIKALARVAVERDWSDQTRPIDNVVTPPSEPLPTPSERSE